MKKSKFSTLIRSIFLAVGILLACWLIGILTIVGYRYIFSPTDDEAWKEDTTPLPKETVDELCFSLEITDDSLCGDSQEVYASDFFTTISEIFAKQDMTYQDVQRKLGKYQVELEPLSKAEDGGTYFVSTYDLRGDGATWIAFFFRGTYEENSFMRVRYHHRNEGLR